MPAEGFSIAAVMANPQDARPVAAAPKEARVIVIGNEKGGAGKSTVSVHVTVALLRMGFKVGIIDLDVRQRTLTRYLENRQRWIESTGAALPMPEIVPMDASAERDLDKAEAEETQRLNYLITRLKRTCDFVLVDAPGSDTFLSRLAHVNADTLITPLNDSFVDFDLLGDVNPQTLEVVRPSFYSEMVWNCRKTKAQVSRRPIDWIVMRNRMSPLAAKNKERVGEALENLSKRIGFRLAPGLSERVIFRELFPAGLTLLDLSEQGSSVSMTMSHVAARQELRDLMILLQLPELAGKDISF
jgi:chromosome partitioning protein